MFCCFGGGSVGAHADDAEPLLLIKDLWATSGDDAEEGKGCKPGTRGLGFGNTHTPRQTITHTPPALLFLS